MGFDVNNSINVYREMIGQASIGRIAAVVPFRGRNHEPFTFMVAADPTRDPAFNVNEWVNDPTDYTALAQGGDYFGNDGIGVRWAVAMIRYAHALARENGLDQLESKDE